MCSDREFGRSTTGPSLAPATTLYAAAVVCYAVGGGGGSSSSGALRNVSQHTRAYT